MSPPIFGIQPGDLGLSGVQRHQVLDYYCLEGIEEAFVFQENFDTPIALNPRWDTVGKVEDVSRSTGWEKIGVDLETPASMMLSKKNLFSIKDDRRAADPPLEWAWRVFCTPPPVPWDATLVCGTVFHETDDDEVYFAFFATLDTDMVYQWSVGVKDGNPEPHDLWKTDGNDGKWPLVFVQNEGFIIRATVPATGVWDFDVLLEWDEIVTTGGYN